MYCLNTNLQVGDVILVRGGKLHSKAIAYATGGHFSHACLCVGERSIIESIMSTGVQYSSPQRFAFMDKKNVAVLRPNIPNEWDRQQFALMVQDVARKEIGKEYDLNGARKCLSSGGEVSTEDKFFCSQLVASIFAKIGFPVLLKPHEKVNPNDFINDNGSKLTAVTDQVVSEIPKFVEERYRRLGESIECLDVSGSSESDSHKILSAYFKKIEPIFKKYGITPPKNIPDTVYILTDPLIKTAVKDIDKKISSKFDRMQVLQKIVASAGLRREYDDVQFLSKEIQKYGSEFIDSEINACMTSISQGNSAKDNVLVSLEGCRQINNKMKLEFFRRAIKYYEFGLQCAELGISLEQEMLSFLLDCRSGGEPSVP